MNKLDPIVLISLQSAGFSEKQLANVFETDKKAVNDYLDCYNTGFDCALLYIGNRLEKAGVRRSIRSLPSRSADLQEMCTSA